ncbi:MAG TPA: hypothetical protein VMT73_02215, partial [Anaerolineales bacterium]|nr:hypothetical protein [Anaerolineales bacterium]
MTNFSFLQKIKNWPVILLIIANVIVGLFIFRDYGFSLDEPLFYGYADAVGYAYSPQEWFSGHFDLTQAYGPSPADHANRGPAYLLLAREPAHLLQALGVDQASAWHLVNFLAFQVGVYFFYVLCRRWMKPWAAFFATVFFSTQPVMWEHAFINPKDPPFLVFFLISLELGFRMADRLAASPPDEKPAQPLKYILLPAIILGLTTSIRVLGPLAAVLVIFYFLLLKKPAKTWWFIPYGLIAILIMFITWPYLWEAPIHNFIGTLNFMSDNPTQLRVLFYGQLYRADNLPIRYLPSLLLFTLTEPVWPLVAFGIVAGIVYSLKKKIDWKTLSATLLWFVIPMVYVLWKHPPMYDGFRHFMFIIPPLFVLGGLAVEVVFDWLKPIWIRVAIIAALLSPALIADVELHPYQYTYYNQFVGGTGQAAYNFETDYWETCYKDAMQALNGIAVIHPTVYVRREGYIAAYYADKRIKVIDGSISSAGPSAGDYFLTGSRASPGIQRYRNNNQLMIII